jgi:hypothetical protein
MQLTGYLVKFETSTRMALHAHHVIMQPPLQTPHVERLLAGADAGRVLGLVERLMCGYLPGACAAERRGRTLVVVPDDISAVRPVDGRFNPTACLPALDDSRAELDAHIARTAVSTQDHAHTHRCRKGGYKGTDESCALAYPRVVQAATTCENGVVLARLDLGRLVFYVPTVMLALPCNHTIGVGIEQSRWARQKHLHDVKVARGEARPQDAPRPQTLHEASLDNSFYMGKYSTKVDDCDTHGEIITLATASDRVRHAAHLVI